MRLRGHVSYKGPFTPSESGSKSEKDQRMNDKHQRKYSLSISFDVESLKPYYSGSSTPCEEIRPCSHLTSAFVFSLIFAVKCKC